MAPFFSLGKLLTPNRGLALRTGPKSESHELKAQGMRPTDIAKALKIGLASVYRVLGTAAAPL